MLRAVNQSLGAAEAPTHREVRTVAILSLGFGLVGIDRFLISTLYPVIARDLHLNYGDIGSITGALALAWGISALFMGNLSDRIGRRRVLTVSLVVFSLLIGASGLATGLVTLIAVRLIMGVADGAYTPASIAGTLAASPPERRGLNIGIQQMMMPLFGLGLAPLFVAEVLRFIDWRWVFLVFVVPGLALALAVWRTLAPGPAPPPSAGGSASASLAASWSDWKRVLSFPNVRVAAVLMLCWLTCLITTSAFMPNYLVDHLKLPLDRMGSVMSAIGLGATVGTLLLPWLSDRLGRKRVMALASVGALAALVLLQNTGAVAGALFGFLFLVHFFNNALITLTVGPLCSEAVPVRLMATASGLVIAVGELFGGGLAPVIVGHAAQRFGIEHVLWLPIVMVGIGFLLCLTIQNNPRQPPLTHGRS
jgi:predicted MFS family arabinose efflux permease